MPGDLYSLALAVGLYIFPLSAGVAVAHAIVALGSRLPMRRRLQAIGAMALGGLLFVPWFLIIVSKLADINASMPGIVGASASRWGTAWRTITLMRLEILDWDGAHRLFVLGATLPITGLLLLAIYDIRRQGSWVTRLFVWSLLGSIAVPLIGLDLALGGHRVETARYFTPMFLALDVCLAALIARRLSTTTPPLNRAVWTCIIGCVFALRISSSALSSQATTWWNSYHMRSHEVAAQINASHHPLIVSDDYVLWPLVLSEYLAPDTEVALRPRCYQCKIPEDTRLPSLPIAAGGEARSLFMIAPSAALQSQIRAQVREPAVFAVACINVHNSCPDGIDLWSSEP